MALDVHIQSNPTVCSRNTHVLYFNENEGGYWFLYPLFQKLEAQTGQIIDLYGYAAFGGENLTALEETIILARQMTQKQPESWEVVTGIETSDPPREIRVLVVKQEILSLLGKLQAALQQAREQNLYIAFWGD